jgi:endonuclease YncB( thermonuclease family)
VYHTEECSNVWQRVEKGVDEWYFKGVPIDLDAAGRVGMRPCKVCKPPKSTAPVVWNQLSGKVARIKDGDTFVVDDGEVEHDIRLEGIDAPESEQRFGLDATKALSGKISGKQIKVEWLWNDKYRRPLGHVYIGDRWINREMVEEGFAWHFKKYSTDQRLADAEEASRVARKGLWGDDKPTKPIPPWEFRENGRR